MNKYDEPQPMPQPTQDYEDMCKHSIILDAAEIAAENIEYFELFIREVHSRMRDKEG